MSTSHKKKDAICSLPAQGLPFAPYRRKPLRETRLPQQHHVKDAYSLALLYLSHVSSGVTKGSGASPGFANREAAFFTLHS